jgi:Delta14-sterol reductase
MPPVRRSTRLSSPARSAASTIEKKTTPSSSSTSTSSASAQKKKTPHFEFGGPVGTTAMLLGLPAVCYGLVAACNPGGCSLDPKTWHSPLDFVPGRGSPFLASFAAVALWFAAQAALHLLLPGPRIEGVPLPDGRRLRYKLTGFRNLLATLAVALAVGLRENPATGEPWLAPCYDYYVPLLTAAVAFSSLLSVALYAASFRGGSGGKKKGASATKPLLASHGDTGCAAYDFFMGRELNPRSSFTGDFDWKEFCELYPGLIGWVVLDLGCAAKQWATARAGAGGPSVGVGGVGGLLSSLLAAVSKKPPTSASPLSGLSPSMALVCAFHAAYVADALWHERAILTTMDVTTDGFGFMLAFGDLAWVPFTYSLQARYLVDYPSRLSVAAIAAILLLNAGAYAIFRGSNSQKDAFRRDPGAPSVRHLRTLETRTGRKLLVSGWWGVARHVNYFGDWLLGWSWCLPCGFAHAVPYFYVAYFAGLLLHRDRRDGKSCAAKYGKDWERYCKIVRWRIVPFVY